MERNKKYFNLSNSEIYPNHVLGRPWWLNSMYLQNANIDVIFAPRNFRIGKSYFSNVPLRHHVNSLEYVYIHANDIKWGYLCALLNTTTYLKRLFGNNIRPYSMQQLSETLILKTPLLEASEDVQKELTVIETIVLSLRNDENAPVEYKRVLNYIVSVFEDVREAYILEIENALMFSLWNISIRKHWKKLLLSVCTGNMNEDIYLLFKELTQPSCILMNNIKRLKLYIRLNKL